MSDEYAEPNDFNRLAQKIDSLNSEIIADFTKLNADITFIVSRSGPFCSNNISQNVTNLMSSTRTNLHVQNEANLYLLSKYLSGYIASISQDDTATG